MKLRDKKYFPLYSLEFMTETDGIIMIRKKCRRVVQDIYIPRIYLLAWLSELKGELK